jgi:hypothetical protein
MQQIIGQTLGMRLLLKHLSGFGMEIHLITQDLLELQVQQD